MTLSSSDTTATDSVSTKNDIVFANTRLATELNSIVNIHEEIEVNICERAELSLRGMSLQKL